MTLIQKFKYSSVRYDIAGRRVGEPGVPPYEALAAFGTVVRLHVGMSITVGFEVRRVLLRRRFC